MARPVCKLPLPAHELRLLQEVTDTVRRGVHSKQSWAFTRPYNLEQPALYMNILEALGGRDVVRESVKKGVLQWCPRINLGNSTGYEIYSRWLDFGHVHKTLLAKASQPIADEGPGVVPFHDSPRRVRVVLKVFVRCHSLVLTACADRSGCQKLRVEL